jgi:hypothetical protein
MKRALGFTMAMAGAVLWLAHGTAGAHCDTLDGPVVKDARAALSKAGEEEIRAAFKKTLAVRGKGPEARELADHYFFETLVRVHRAGEGAPYTGLKPAGAVEPIVAAADKALETGSAEALAKHVTHAIEAGIQKRFAAAVEAKKHADESVEAGRKFVAAYVDYVHFVEGLHAAATSAHHHGEAAAEAEKGTHEQHQTPAKKVVAPEHHKH